MAIDDNQKPSRSKHRRNSDDETEEASKRQKHRHHRHHHHRRHRHHRSKKQDDRESNENADIEIASQPVPPSDTTAVVVSNGDWRPDYDMEEGEIVDDDCQIGGYTNNQVNNSDQITDGVQAAVDSDRVIVEDQDGKVGSSQMVLGDGNFGDGFKGNPTDVEKGESSVFTEICNGIDLQRSSSVENRVNGDIVKNENDKYLKSSEVKEYLDDKNGRRGESKSLLSDTPTERHTSFEYSPSEERYNEKYGSTNRSGSDDHGRERSRSQSIIQDVALLHNRHVGVAYDTVRKQTINSDDETMSKHQLDNQHGGRDSLRDKKREHSSSYYSRHNIRTDDSSFRDKSCEEQESTGERDRNIERERGRNREREWERERERKRARGKEREIDERERERKRDSDRGKDRDRERERERDRERERERDRERRGRERERRDREGNRIRMKEDDRDIVYHKHHDADNIGDRERLSDRRHQRSDDTDYRDRTRDIEKEQIHTHKTDNSETNTQELHRDEDEQEDYKETAVLQFAEQEEEDLNRIKEESRRRRQAILEKYRSQQAQQKHEQKSEETGTGSAKQPLITVAETHNGQNESADMFLNETSFSLGKSPEQTEPPALKSSGTGALGEGTPKSERSDDMFCDDIFGASPAGVRKQGKGDGFKIERSGLHDNWDDAEGYYSYRFGEVLDGRYEVIAAHGKGVYSNVVRAKDLKAGYGYGNPEEVAIKIIRSNDTMYKAGLEELVILKKLVGADPEDRRHCVRLLSSFKYRNHLCLVFESLHMNLREVLKKFGRNIGLKLTAVRAYAKQLFIALKHLKNCGVLHSDIKPDNMLVNEAKNVLKLSDFGNAMFAGKNEITPYLVSRFYRAPEIILGLTYDHPMDIWSVGCCLYELYTGKVLFPGPSNNDMLRLHMELKGPFPKKMLRKGAFTDQHFDQDLNFLATEEDPVTKKAIRRLILNIKPKDISAIISGSAGDDPKMLANFKDILEKIFVLDPDKRITVSQALSHPFITGK